LNLGRRTTAQHGLRLLVSAIFLSRGREAESACYMKEVLNEASIVLLDVHLLIVPPSADSSNSAVISAALHVGSCPMLLPSYIWGLPVGGSIPLHSVRQFNQAKYLVLSRRVVTVPGAWLICSCGYHFSQWLKYSNAATPCHILSHGALATKRMSYNCDKKNRSKPVNSLAVLFSLSIERSNEHRSMYRDFE
jgi:hypothetical protein